jgi:hypothetical protein
MLEQALPILSVFVIDGPVGEGVRQGQAMLDSMWRADSTAYLRTLAAIITDPLFYSHQAASSAAGNYARHNGPATWLLRAYNGLGESRRVLVLDALNEPLSTGEQRFLFRQACATAIGVAALTPHLGEMHRISGQEDPPAWFEDGLLELGAIRDLLEGDLAAEFDRIVGPILEQADEEMSRWITS